MDLRAIGRFVQLHQQNRDALVGKSVLDLDAKRAERLGEDDDCIVFDKSLESAREGSRE